MKRLQSETTQKQTKHTHASTKRLNIGRLLANMNYTVSQKKFPPLSSL